KQITTKTIHILLSAAVLLLPAVLLAQPDPGGPGGGGGMAAAPIDPASWLIPAGLAAYYKWKQKGKEKKVED
ncbi:MAG: hypothetical protein KIS94_16250, partial [Chitinophagales bacterium]|nr:hypothetical protein [Chitinophagales bacterium]